MVIVVQYEDEMRERRDGKVGIEHDLCGMIFECTSPRVSFCLSRHVQDVILPVA